MNNAPTVYVPTQPEGDGLTLPTLLSLLAHSIILGVLIYTYQTPKIETAGSIETTMVTPGELAQMQGQILANRAAAAEQAASASSSASTQMQMNESTSSDADQNSAQPSAQQEPVFTRSDESSSSRPMLMSEEQHQKRLEQMTEYNRNVAEAAAALDGTQALDEFRQQQRDELIEEEKELRDFRAKANNQPRVNKPTRSDRNINIELGGSGNAGKTFDLADGQATVSGGSSSATSNQSSGGSRGASNSEIASLIKSNYSPPSAAKGSIQLATLTITVNSNGDVLTVSASGANEAVNKAAEQAVRKTRNLPVSAEAANDKIIINFNGSN